MFSLFKSAAKKELDGIIFELDNYLQNNYKDPAHEMRKKLKARSDELFSEGKLKEEEYKRYLSIFERYTEMMKDYRH